MAIVPDKVRVEVIEELVRQFDAARWEELSSHEASGMYDRFVKDPKIGVRLSTYIPADKIRVWIKDGPAKEYRRALEGTGPVAPFTKRAYPGPESLVRLALGDRWTPKEGTIKKKPMRCFAEHPDGSSMFLIWGPFSALQGLIWNSCLLLAKEDLNQVTVVVTKPSSTSLPREDWDLVKRLCGLIGANCKQVTYAVIRKPEV